MIVRLFESKFSALKVCTLGYLFLLCVKWREKRRWAVHPINQSRNTKGEFVLLCKELEDYPERYHHYFRMDKERFDFILDCIEDKIKGENTNFKSSISPKEKLVLTLK